MSYRWALAGLSLSMVLSSLGTSVANVALPNLAVSFAAPFQAVQWVVIAYVLTVTCSIVAIGWLGDAIGRRRLLIGGLILFIAASALCGMAPSLETLIAGRALQGLGGATLLALSMAFVGDIAPKERFGAAIGLLGTMSAVGTSIGPSLGGVLIDAFGWRSIFLINLPLGVAALYLTITGLPADKSRDGVERPAFDFAGIAVMALALGAYALAMTLGRGDFGAVNAGMLAAAAIGLFVFLRIEARASSPLIGRDLFRDPILRAGFVCSLLVSTVLFATLIVGPFHLARVFDLSPAAIGAIVAAGPIAAAFIGVPAGRLADRFGAGLVSLAGLVGIEIGCVLIVTIPAGWGPLGYLFATMVMTIGYALFQNANNAHVMQGIDPRKRGVVAGLINLSRNLGQVTGAAAMGALFAYASGPADVLHAEPASVDFGTRATYGVATLLIGAAILFAARKAGLKRT